MTGVARWLSLVAHPFVMVGVMVGTVAARRSSAGEALRSVAIVLAFTVIPMLVLMVRQVRAGAWENVDASNRKERPILYLVCGLGLAALVAYSFLAGAQSFLLHGVVGTLAMVGVCALATRWIKVSLHMAFATLATTCLLLLPSRVGWVLLPLVPALAWSRLFLARHRPLEVILGTAIGLCAALWIVLL
jgi:membrane-associated phospholipid phosphatase